LLVDSIRQRYSSPRAGPTDVDDLRRVEWKYTSTVTFTVFVGDADESVSNGSDADSCPSGIAPPSAVGEPVNVTNLMPWVISPLRRETQEQGKLKGSF